ncbi:MAG: alpha/beta hydrolase [Proteobacteria bacterium]|nr:alpha/beta hydrolase [Pseudomonadota bacterium]
MPTKLLFLPGASGNTSFWTPVSVLLTHPARKVFLGWPGFGPTPQNPNVKGIKDLVKIAVAEIDQPTALIAQSMGGVVAILAALEKPDLVTHLILTVTSGGMNVASFKAKDWRPRFQQANPTYPEWFATYHEDLTPELYKITIPSLLLWGDADPISPVGIGEKLASLLPNASFHVFPGGDHDLANKLAKDLAPLIDNHLSKSMA